ncbi:Prostamide/prostaglandin F synthase [Orchesella cincta]|uniref:Prostamide/prostaglandin F synthase n=1 Tax=Orchesella cincta TaxID=48709 RepID=A0A1D2N7E3_ORCCI|nr:Prostamide/prostaglandin F synthase [Orchesella cincta]
MTTLLSKKVVVTGTFAAALSALYAYSGSFLPAAFFGTIAASNHTMDLTKIGKNVVKKVPSMEKICNFWDSLTGRGARNIMEGRHYCSHLPPKIRMIVLAKELSTLTPLLASHGVKNIAVGLENFGLDEFVEGQFFNGDLYVDVDKKTYKDIGYKRFGTIGVLMSLFGKAARDRIAQNRQENLPSNLKGDGLQNGGTLVIAKGGAKVLLDYRQDNPADHIELSEILKVLNIPNPESNSAEEPASTGDNNGQGKL